MSSILNDTKKLLGITEDYTAFDTDIIMHINAAFSRLRQLGVGDQNGFAIHDATTTWDDFLDGCSPSVRNKLSELPTYIYLSTRIMFDPPNMNQVIESYKNLMSEFEWRMNLTVEMAERDENNG